MKLLQCLLAVCGLASAAAANLRHSFLSVHEVHNASKAFIQHEGSLDTNAAGASVGGKGQGTASIKAQVDAMLVDLLKEDGKVTLQDIIRTVNSKMTYQEALDRLSDKMPKDVAVLVKVGHSSSSTAAAAGAFSEDSLQKARKILNGMVEASQAELDDAIIDCEEFKRSNRKTFSQVVTDLARLGSEIAAAEEKVAENMACVAAQDGEFKTTAELLKNEAQQYAKNKAADDAELTLKRNDLAVFNFIMDVTKCQEEKAGDKKALVQVGANETMPLFVCNTNSGFEINFKSPKVQADFDAIMTPSARLAIRDALGLAFSGALPGPQGAGSFMQADPSEPVLTPDAGHENTTEPPRSEPVLTQKPVPVKQDPPKDSQWKKCTDGKPNCGLLHDTMSLQWGKFKDLVDELQAHMEHNQDEWEKLKSNLNDQLKVLTHGKGECQTKFDQAVGSKNTLTNERNEKDDQHHELTALYEDKMSQCKARIEELLFTDVCAVRTVRNVVMKESKLSPPLNISDCEVGDWVAKPCSVDCDDTCPHMVGRTVDPYSCGGWMDLNRAIIVNVNQWGIKCPALTRKTRCGQFKCSVDCKLSEWSGWSKCTKECEGGAQQMTRSIIVKPKHGGEECAATVDTRACNTGSCDRDCSLNDWTVWAPCSMACNPGGSPGYQERTRSVLVPIRGQGKCPVPEGPVRYEKQTCNEQSCHGDEICIAKMDLIIALDASGSLREEGYKVVREFAANFTTRFQAQYLGMETVRIGAILFGNGARKDDGTIAGAIVVSPLTDDFAAVAKNIHATTWQKGFTNMAQAFLMADTLFQQGGRSDAQSAVLVLSDGKYSFAFETEKAVNALKAKGTQILMAPIASRPGNFEAKLKLWASQPWETNYELIPGVTSLANNMETYKGTLIAKFCSDALSPTASFIKESELGMMMIREGGKPDATCSPKPRDLGYVPTVRECKIRAEQKAGALAFSMGREKGKQDRHCYAESFNITSADWSKFSKDKRDIPCAKGNWTANPAFDTYIIQPL